MFCPKCGTKNSEDSKYCYACGNLLPELVNKDLYISINVEQNQVKKKNSGLAIAGFVLSLVGLVYFVILICGLIGLIFSIIGLNETKYGEKKGKGFAISGFVISCIDIIFFLILLI